MTHKKKKTAMPEQHPGKRKNNFDEVALGYTKEQAMEEAERCLNCKKPACVKGCPVNVRIPEFIALIKEGDFMGAAEEILKTNNLPAICGRVCPQEDQCEKMCILSKKGDSVAIGRLERFAADYYMANKPKSGNPKNPVKQKGNAPKVAVVGGGPAGLTAAADLAKCGYKVTVFEALHRMGGVLVYGIPEFRLPKRLVKQEIDALKDLGVEFMPNVVIGKTITIDELLKQGYQAVFIGTGAGLPKFMNIPGENLNGVYSANEYLTRVNLMGAYDFPKSDTPIIRGGKVAVVGGGNVAMDAARCALRLGAEKVYIVYRRSEGEMPARKEEVQHAKEEGIIFKVLTNPVEILGKDGWVTGIKCIRTKLGQQDESGRGRPIPIEGSEFVLDVDVVIMAIGTDPNPLIAKTTSGIDVQPWGGIIVDQETGQTSRKGVYAGGDAVTGAATVIQAMGAGKKAARAIDKYLKQKK
ncbi:MAG TPA: NADPH-dependent glutamate synthase [Clostridiales bacterium]|nr:NADPH-dependent glutamate synthase [Clostridiales bacterium]